MNLFPNTVTIDDVYQSLNFTGIYNQKIMADIYLDYHDPGWSNAFTYPNSLYYLRYLALNFGLGGLFRPMTPY